MSRMHGYEPRQELRSLVISGGKGSRLEERRKIISEMDFPSLKNYRDLEGPKALAILEIAGARRPLLDWHLDLHAAIPQISSITLGLGFKAECVRDYYRSVYNDVYRGKPLTSLTEKRPAGTLAPFVKMARANLLTDAPLLIANGDNLLNVDFYGAYLEGIDLARRAGVDPNETVIILAARVSREESGSYGVLDIDDRTGFAREFCEKRAANLNPYETIDGRQFCRINSGFSIIVNPLNFLQKINYNETSRLMDALESGEIDYKTYEKEVKYETVYEKLADDGLIAVLKSDVYWADSGSEAQMTAIETGYGSRIKS